MEEAYSVFKYSEHLISVLRLAKKRETTTVIVTTLLLLQDEAWS
jgi:hypothetical protein